MQVILLEKVANLGELGSVVKVKDGYARNFLIPQGKAKRATPENLAEFEQRRAELEKVQAEALSAAQEKSAKLDGLAVSIPQKAGVDGKLFGSVTAQDIADALGRAGHQVDRRRIELDHPIKSLGDHTVSVRLHPEVHAEVRVTVVPE